MSDTDRAGAALRQRNTAEGVARSAGITSVAVLASRLTGLAREMALARLFGAGMANDAFLLAFRIPNLTRDLFAEGALSSAFVPTFVEYLQKKTRADAAYLANLVATAIIVVVGAVCLLGMAFAPELVNLLAPGFHQVPGKFEMAVAMTRIMSPFLLLVALAAQVMGILNACNRFALPALSSSMFNVGSLLFGLFMGHIAGPQIGISAIEGMAWGVVFGGALQLGAQIPSLVREGFHFKPALDFHHPGLIHICKLMGPAILGNAAVQINVMVNSNFASQIVDPVTGLNGPVTWVGCAFRFMQLPLGLFGVAIGGATLPAISRAAANGDMDDFRRTLSRSLGLVFLLTIPSSAGLSVIGDSIIGSLFEGGAFRDYDTQQTAAALAWFAVGLVGYAALKILVPAFYALKDSRTPMYISLISIATNYFIVSNMTQVHAFGHAGLALSTAAVAISGAIAQFIILRNRVGGIYGRALFSSVMKITFAAAVMSFGVWAAAWLAGQIQPVGRGRYLATLALAIPTGLALYYYTCRTLKIEEMDLAVTALAKPLERLRARIR
ncbi:MAG: murein biosynthesis integral membrane protein MurJ [Bryobacterales bacterium]|nr:murein biosynthesis integral membrane protein MurJ [Bryobacterales bacterium]